MKFFLLVVCLMGVVAAQYDSEVERQLDAYRRALMAQRMSRRGQGDYMDRPRDASTLASLAFIKKKCDENGSPDAYKNVERAIEQVQPCVENAVMFTPKPRYGGVQSGVRYACRLAPQLASCLINLGEAMRPCMSPKRRENFILANFTKSVISYACDNDGARTQAFMAGGGPQCISNQGQELKECADRVDPKEAGDSLENSIESGELTETDCKQFTELRQCMVSGVSQCPTQAAEEFLKGLFDILEGYLPCKQMNQPEGLIEVQMAN